MSRALGTLPIKVCFRCHQTFLASPKWERQGGRYEITKQGVRYYCLDCSQVPASEVKPEAAPALSDLTSSILSDLPAVLTAEEVAKVLRIPKSSVYDLAARGKLPCVKLGRTWRMSKVALVAFLSGSIPANGDMSTGERR